MIPIPDLQIHGVYKVRGRNFSVAIWDGECFIGRRYKFGWGLSGEQHHDSSPTCGTVEPHSFLFHAPASLVLEEYGADNRLNYALFGYLTVVEDAFKDGDL